jgi:hypothetical protein
MLSLSIAGRRSAPDGPILAANPGVEVWRDLDGRIAALAERRDGTLRLSIPGVALYELGAGSAVVRALADDESDRHRVIDQFYRTVLPLALQARGYEALHASAVRGPAGVIALCATKESGKSTLAYALGERGYSVWADDAVVFRAGAEGVAALEVPFDLRLRPESAAHFGQSRHVPGTRARRDGREPITLAPAPLAALFVLERSRDPAGPNVAPRSRRLTGGAAFTALLTHAYSFGIDEPERRQRMVEQYLALAARVPVHELRYGTGLEQLPAILDELERALAGGS